MITKGVASTIHVFVANGANILTNGQTDTLSIFDFDSGLLKSKGTVDIGNVECVGTNNAWGTLIACSRGNKIQLIKGDFEGPCPSENSVSRYENCYLILHLLYM